ncbi:MAG: AraC family transcriptional regulator, partial [Bacteroidota bacterium]
NLQPQFRFRLKHLGLYAVPIFFVLEWVSNRVGLPFQLYSILGGSLYYTTFWVLLFLGGNLFFSIISLQLIRNNGIQHPKQKRQLRWLKWVLYSFMAMLGVAVIMMIVFVSLWTYTLYYEITLLILCEVFILIMIFNMLRNSVFLKDLGHQEYANSQRDQSFLAGLYAQFETCMQEKTLYRDSGLTLAQLSEACKISEHQLSQVFSQYKGSNFYDMVNRFRLDEVEKMLPDPAFHHLTITAVAQECGFRSKAAFYNAFRKRHQMTPSQWLKNLQATRA